MPGNPPPISDVIEDGVAVPKSDVRSYANTRGTVRMADAAEVQAADLTAVFQIHVGLALYYRDGDDTTSADDGVTILVDAAGNRWKRAPVLLPIYAFSDLPDAADWEGGLLYISDEDGGAVPAFSDGTNWRRVTDRTIAST